MGAKLSRKKKGYDVSDPKGTKDETAAAANAGQSVKVEDAATPTEAQLTTEAGTVVEEAVGSAVAAETEAVKAPEEHPPAAPESAAPAPEEPAAVSESATPAPEEPAAVSESATPAPEEPAAVIEEAAPAPEEPAAVEEPVVVADEPAFSAEKPVPVIEEQALPELQEALAAAAVVAAAAEEPVIAKDEPTAPVSEEPVTSEPKSAATAVPEADVSSASIEDPPVSHEPELIPETVTESEMVEKEIVMPVPLIEDESVAETPQEPVLEQVPEPEPEPEPETEKEAELQPEPQLEQVPEPEIEKSPEPEQAPEPEQESYAMDPAAEEQVPEDEPEPIVLKCEITEPEAVEAPEVLGTDAGEVPLEKEESVATEVSCTEVLAEPEAVEPVPEIIISETQVTAESDEVAESSVAEVPCPEPEVDSKMENGNVESPSPIEDVAEEAAPPALNGECTESSTATTLTEECVNGSEDPVEMTIKNDFELKKDVSGGVPEVPDGVADMVEALSTEVTQAV
ncbi:uncharacterized protein ACBR49_003350 [Aulostomus maculatus]